MASMDNVRALRRAVDVADGDAAYPDVLMSALIDAEGSVNSAAARIWREKAATLAALVDTTESGSSRKLSDLHKNALAMAESFTAADAGVAVAASSRSFTVGTERV